MLWSQQLHTEIACLWHAYVAPRELTLLALGGASEAKATRTALGIERRQSESALHACVALQADHERLARALTIGVAGDETIGSHKRTCCVATASTTLRIAEVADGTTVAGATCISLATLTLSANRCTKLTNRTDVIAFALTTAQTRLPTPGPRHTLCTGQAACELWTNATSIDRITHLTLCRTCGTALTSIGAKAIEALGALVTVTSADTDFTITLTRPGIALMTACTVWIALAIVTSHTLREIPVSRFTLVTAATCHIEQAGALTGALVAGSCQGTNGTALTICKKGRENAALIWMKIKLLRFNYPII